MIIRDRCGPSRALALMIRTCLLPAILPGSVLAEAPAPRHEAAGPQAMWRRPENDGVNCLFLMLGSLGYQGLYEPFLREISGVPGIDSLSGLARAAEAVGFGIVPVRMTMAEIEGLHRPVIVHLEQQAGDSGYYVLVRGFDAEEVILYHGGKATPETIPRDVFRREWSGFGLVPDEESGWIPVARRVAAGLTAALAVCFASYRLR